MGDRTSVDSNLRIVIDSNVFIAVEDHDDARSAHTYEASELFRLAFQAEASLVIAAETKDDIMRGPWKRNVKRLAQLAKYDVLSKAFIRPELAKSAGFPTSRTPNDQSDLSILAALDSGAADWLVTNDGKLRRRAAKAGFSDSVFSVQHAVDTLRTFFNQPTSIPEIRTVKGHEINPDAPVFHGLENSYPDFATWWREKVVRSRRDILILGSVSNPEGASVLKVETDYPHRLVGKVLKLCTFKVAEAFEGERRGELLLTASIDYARRNQCQQLYLEVKPENQPFIEWLTSFGFKFVEDATTTYGDVVFKKELLPLNEEQSTLDPLAFSVEYGPGKLLIHNPLIIPIQVNWRRRLLPQPDQQLPLLRLMDASGNAIRKAYICRAPIRNIDSGDTLLFYESSESGGRAAIVSLGVAETTLVSRDVDAIMRFVGNRTVFSPQDIAALCDTSDVLAIRFRFDRTLDRPWLRQELIDARVIPSAPQSIQRVKNEGIGWIQSKLTESP
jgi:ribosomal protein S18 acetylase RimI-like enzyme